MRDGLRLAVSDRSISLYQNIPNAILTTLVLNQNYCSAFHYLASHLGIEPESEVTVWSMTNDSAVVKLKTAND
ncbi:hypothetical protein [Chlorogloeopsis sp. ULAP02]|uniref:hypothetical protein n=1 Tax=Chlorogloeopsis sp. ULAP02 TaxID=3107926 RepID=UPI00313624A1